MQCFDDTHSLYVKITVGRNSGFLEYEFIKGKVQWNL